MQAGCNACVSKPIDFRLLKRQLAIGFLRFALVCERLSIPHRVAQLPQRAVSLLRYGPKSTDPLASTGAVLKSRTRVAVFSQTYRSTCEGC